MDKKSNNIQIIKAKYVKYPFCGMASKKYVFLPKNNVMEATKLNSTQLHLLLGGSFGFAIRKT